ncbi:hypothetical protein [Paludisphaera rhizosphaerae]|uniref:hypothetical protein n=1 Tax=Paludisphaera rhizosphaerae TaxID=2711216 RepID=UPI0013E9D3C1|nr:hypothetical protein [Paludisphaera rhizosphaerae]
MFQWMYKHAPNGFWYKVRRRWDLSRLWLRNRRTGISIIAAFLLIAGLWATSLYLSFLSSTHSWPQKLEGMGQVGDSFGAVNSLFTGLTLFFLVFTIHLQRKEIVENRRALAEANRDQYLAARLNASAALLEAYDRDGSRSASEDGVSGRYAKWERARLRQTIRLLECEAKIHVSGRWTQDHEVASLLMLIRDMYLMCSHERHEIISDLKKSPGPKDATSLGLLRDRLLKLYREWYKAVNNELLLLSHRDSIPMRQTVVQLIEYQKEFISAIEAFASQAPLTSLEAFDDEPAHRGLNKTVNALLSGPSFLLITMRERAEEAIRNG